MREFFIVSGIIIAVITTIYFIGRLFFMLTVRRTIDKNNFRLDVIIQNQSELFVKFQEVINKYNLKDERLDEALAATVNFQHSNLKIKKRQLQINQKAKEYLDEIAANPRLNEDIEFLTVKTNIDDLFSSLVTFTVQYNKEVKLYNRHIKMISGRFFRFILRWRYKENL